jgi:hypothetical protein
MRGLLTKSALRFAVVCSGIAAILLSGMAIIFPRSTYYLGRSNYHAGQEQLHKSKARESEQTVDRRNPDLLSYTAEEEATLALQHAELKRRYRQAAYAFWQCAPADVPLPYPWLKERDSRVLEAALLALIDEKRRTLATSMDRVPFIPRVVVDKWTSIEEFEDWYKVEIMPGEGLPIDVAADLQRRNGEIAVPLAEFRFDSGQILVDDLEALRSDALGRYPNSAAFVRASLPGYSRDGTIGLVAIRDVLSEHPAGRVLALVMSGGRWHLAGTDYFAGE